MTEGLANEMQGHGIAVNGLKPLSAIETPGFLFAQLPRGDGGNIPDLPAADSYVEAAVLLALQTPATFTGHNCDDAEVIALLADAASRDRFRQMNPGYWGARLDSVPQRTGK